MKDVIDVLQFDKDSCPVCKGRGEHIDAYICFGPKPRHETSMCFSCDGTGRKDIYILNQLEEKSFCPKHRIAWGSKAIKSKSEHAIKQSSSW